MLRRIASIAAAALLCFGAVLLVRPAFTRPVLANLDGPASPATQLTAAVYQSRAQYNRRLEPADTLLHGAGQSDRASFDRYSAATATHPTLFMTYPDLRDDLPAYFTQLTADLAHFDSPGHVTIPQIGLALNRGKATAHYEAETAAGADDPALAELGSGLRALHRPVFVRPGYEFNGSWNGYQPAHYIDAFRRIAATLHSCSPGIALVWNWSPDAELDAQAAGYSPSTFPHRLQAFYPGDDAVDWWALNLFTPQGITAPVTARFLQQAAASSHPVMVAESSPKGFHTTDAAVQTAWFAPYFNLLRANPGIKAFCYIDWNWAAYPQWSDWGDARLERAPALLAWFRAQLAQLPLDRNASYSAAPPGKLHTPLTSAAA